MTVQRNLPIELRNAIAVLFFAGMGSSVALPALAQTQPMPAPPTLSPATGVTPLPQDPPPTDLQAPLPAPALPLPKPDKALQTSPTAQQLAGRLVTRPLTLDQAVAIALATNRNLALATESLLLAQGRTSEARAALNPTLGGTASYTRLDQGQTANFGMQTITVQSADNPQLGLSGTLPLDISGELRMATQQAQFQEIAARLDVNRARNQAVLDVKTSFYDVLRNQALVNVAEQSLQDSLARLNDAQKKYGAGVVARFDVIRAQTDVANAQQQVITARSNVSSSFATLNDTIGIDVNAPLQISDQGAVVNPPGVSPPEDYSVQRTTAPPGGANATSPTAPPVTPAPGPPSAIPEETPILTPTIVSDPLPLGPDYSAVVQEAQRTRPEILEADADIAAARKGIQVARRSQLPTLGVTVSGSYVPNASLFQRTASAQAVITLNLPFLDGGLARARVREARANVDTAVTDRRQMIDLVNLQVRQAYLTLLQARDRVAVANQALAEARESFRLARVRYVEGVSAQAGISPLLEVSDAQAALTQASSNQVNALYDYNNARARLDQAVGRYSYVNNAPGYAAPPPPKTVGNPAPGAHK